MMQNLYNEMTEMLHKEAPDFFVNKKFNKSKVSDAAYSYDTVLLEILLKNEGLKKQFFVEAGNALVFKQHEFLQFLNNKSFLKDSYTEFKNQIGLQNERGEYYRENKDVVLVFPHKDCVLEGGQDKEDQKRNEIFYNETLAPDEITRLFEPKTLTNFKLYDSKGESILNEKSEIDFSKQNLILKGNNLLALHSLKKIKSISGQVKLIYIDPPYNTGSDSFHYNDKFNHSTWLTFMKNRLEIARDLLRNDGIIYVQCDDNEQAYLRVLLDEVFKSNYLVSFYIQVRYEGKTLVEDMDFQKMIETIHVYGKTKGGKLIKKESDYEIDKFIWSVKETGKPVIIELGGKKVEIFEKGKYEILKGEASKKGLKEIWASGAVLDGNSSGRFFRDFLAGRSSKDGLGVVYKVYGIGDDSFDYRYFTGPQKPGATKGKYFQGVPLYRLDESIDQKKFAPISNFYDLAGAFGNCRQEGKVELRSGKKPEELLKLIIELSTNENDIVLDYHFGTGTTGAVAHKMKRRYIGLEQLDYEENGSVTRLKNVISGDTTGITQLVNWQGGGSFVYAELKRYNQQYIDDIEEAKDTNALQKLYAKMKEEAFFRIEIDHEKWDNGEFEKLTLAEQKQLLCECLDKNHLYVNLSEMADNYYNLSDDDIALNKKFYGI